MSDTFQRVADPGTEKLSPYAHWWKTKEKEFLPDDIKFRETVWDFYRAEPSTGKNGFQLKDSLYDGGKAVPLPLGVTNEGQNETWSFSQIDDRLPDDIPDDTVITGILDTGVSLGHMMTNIGVGNTRIISAWQQGAMMNTAAERIGPPEFFANALYSASAFNKFRNLDWIKDSPVFNTPGSAPPEFPTRNFTDQFKLDEPWLPCGREIFSGEINAALEHFGDGSGTVDEVAFNRHLRLSAPTAQLGNRDLEMASAHGTHTLSLAAGMDPALTDEDDRKKNRIVAINLPAQYSHGSAGNFLAYFAVFGVERILHVADALWLKNNPDHADKPVFGYPIVINFSYGMTAGPKDGYHLFELYLKNMILERRRRITTGASVNGVRQVASPVRIIMPTGNDNLEQGAASAIMGASDLALNKKGTMFAEPKVSLPWRVLPDDATANFLEIWTQAKKEGDFNTVLKGATIRITRPGGTPAIVPLCAGPGEYDLDDYARVYIRHIAITKDSGAQTMTKTRKPNDENRFRLVLLICVAPTTIDLPGAPTAPAGEWMIDVDYADPTVAVDFTFYIQSDQSAVVTSQTGKRSYFDHPNYRTHLTEHHNLQWATPPLADESGAVADTTALAMTDTEMQVDTDDWYVVGPVQRRGTHNALSTLNDKEMLSVASYDDSKGFPTSYSASSDGNHSKEDKVGKYPGNNGRRYLTIALPGENAPSLFGLLGAGARDGSVIGSRGTSMSTGLATRIAAEAFAKTKSSVRRSASGTDHWFRELGKKGEAENRIDSWGQDLTWPLRGEHGVLKMGSGRLGDPRKNQVHRLGGDTRPPK